MYAVKKEKKKNPISTHKQKGLKGKERKVKGKKTKVKRKGNKSSYGQK